MVRLCREATEATTSSRPGEVERWKGPYTAVCVTSCAHDVKVDVATHRHSLVCVEADYA